VPNIFDRFYKVDASRAGSATGSGLGLSVVKAVVDRHGGTIAVSSSPLGTAFELRLPTGEAPT
jgi:signal transduction histidine kinase